MSLPQRKSPRLQGYDYTQNRAYFVTICTHERQFLFGDVENAVMRFSAMGQIAEEELIHLSSYWPQSVELECFVVMPNHIHAVIALVGTPFLTSDLADVKNGVPTSPVSADAQKRVPTMPTLGRVVGLYKAGVTRRIREWQGDFDMYVWQERYHDHIIRDDDDLERIRNYIVFNPARWHEDRFFEV